MNTKTEILKVSDDKGFHYEVSVVHSPHFGFSTAYYDGFIIGQVELGRILEPYGDDDHEWECYEEKFSEWADEINSNMLLVCKTYFNIKNSNEHSF